MFPVVAMKSRTFSSFSRWAEAQPVQEQGGSTARQGQAGHGNIAYCSHHAQLMNGAWLGGRDQLLSFPWALILPRLGVRSFPGVQSFRGVLQNSQNLQFLGSVISARGLAANQSSGGEKIVLYIVYFACLSLLAVLLVSLLLPDYAVFISTHEFPLLFVPLPPPAGGRGGVSERLSGAWLSAARLNRDSSLSPGTAEPSPARLETAPRSRGGGEAGGTAQAPALAAPLPSSDPQLPQNPPPKGSPARAPSITTGASAGLSRRSRDARDIGCSRQTPAPAGHEPSALSPTPSRCSSCPQQTNILPRAGPQSKPRPMLHQEQRHLGQEAAPASPLRAGSSPKPPAEWREVLPADHQQQTTARGQPWCSSSL